VSNKSPTEKSVDYHGGKFLTKRFCTDFKMANVFLKSGE